MRSVRTKLQKKIQQQAKVTLDKFQNELPESSEQSIALKVKEWTIPPPFISNDIKKQVQEINGKLQFDADAYHNQRYNDLMKKLIVYRNEFP